MGAAAYLRLARLQTSGVTAAAPVIGLLAARHDSYGPAGASVAAFPLWNSVLFLALLGFCAHVFGFVHNEIADRLVDAKAGTHRPKPLPSGAVSLRGAWALAGAGLAGGLAISAVFAHDRGPIVLVLTGASIALAVLYNVAGKAVVGGDAFLAASLAIFVMVGGAAFSGLEGALSVPVLGLAGVTALILFFNNAFEGGFKDHVSDKEGGKRTLVLALRARSAKYDSPDGLLLFAQLPVHAAMGLLSVALVLGPMSAADAPSDWVRVGLLAVLGGAMVRFYNRGIALQERRASLAMFARHEGCALLLLLVPLLLLIPMEWWLLLFVGPLVIFVAVNKALFGTYAAPDV